MSLSRTADGTAWTHPRIAGTYDDDSDDIYWRYRLTEAGAEAIRRARLEAAWSRNVPTEPGPYWMVSDQWGPDPVAVALLGHILPAALVVVGFEDGGEFCGHILTRARWHAWQDEPPEVPDAG